MQPENLNHAMKLAIMIYENKAQSSSQSGVPSAGQTTNKEDHFRMMTESELEERRVKGLCFQCEEKFKPSNRCASHTLQVMIVDDSDLANEPYLQFKPWDHAIKAD
nr:putative mitochondrial protein [Tanacetum cinerariifolium]